MFGPSTEGTDQKIRRRPSEYCIIQVLQRINTSSRGIKMTAQGIISSGSYLLVQAVNGFLVGQVSKKSFIAPSKFI